MLSTILTVGSSDEKGLAFIIVFVIVWLGAFIITLNTQFLGSTMTFFQSVCILGYCLFPINIAALLVRILYFLPIYIKMVIALAGFVWSSYCNSIFKY
jgi:hypothetical protein